MIYRSDRFDPVNIEKKSTPIGVAHMNRGTPEDGKHSEVQMCCFLVADDLALRASGDQSQTGIE